MPRPLRTQVLTFMKRSKALLATWADLSTKDLLRPARHKGDRLAAYGICQRVPCVASVLCLSEANAQLMHSKLATLLDDKPLDATNAKLVRPSKLRLHKAPSWDPHGTSLLRILILRYQTNVRHRLHDDPMH